MNQTTKEISPLNRLIGNFKENLDELKELLKLPEKYEQRAKLAKKKLDEFTLPLLISKVEEDLKNLPKNVDKSEIQKILDELIEEYKKIAPKNISKMGKLKIKIDKNFFNFFFLKQLEKDRDKFKHAISHKIHIEKAVLFNLVSYLEQSFSEVSHIVLSEHPEILCLNEKSLTFDELKKFTELEDAKDYLISLEIEKLLLKPLSYFFSFFEKKMFKTEFQSLSKYKKEIVEIRERRNLLIHNGGVVNAKYINSVDASLLKTYKIKKGDKVGLGKAYLKESIEKFELVGLEMLSFATLKFQDKEHKEEAGWEIISTVYDTFAKKNKNFFLGENFSQFILSEDCKKHLTEKQKDYCLFNYWYILKKQKKIELFEKETSKYDATAKNHIIQLCYFSLIEDYDRAYRHLRPSLNEEDFGLQQYKNFPILEGLRKQKKSKEIIKAFQKKK